MGKRLPYFQFEPAEWLAGDIMFCSLAAQGLFVNLMALYWQKDCEISLEQAIKRLGNETVFDELINEKIIKISSGNVTINFLDEQFKILSERSKINSQNGALGGRPKKQIKTEKKPTAFNSVNQNESETKAKQKHIEENREDNNKIKEKEINYRNHLFLNENLSSESWLEIQAMQNKISIDEVKNKLKEFSGYLFGCSDEKTNQRDFNTHFTNWLKNNSKSSIANNQFSNSNIVKGVL